MSATTKSAIQTASLYSLEKVRELSAASTTRDTLNAAESRAVPIDASSVTRSVAQVDQLAHLAYTRAAPSTDSRYVKFVEAVRALRVDLDLSSLSRAQIDRILESAARMYLINDGIPEPVEPLPIEPSAEASPREVSPKEVAPPEAGPAELSPAAVDPAETDRLELPRAETSGRPDTRAASAEAGDRKDDAAAAGSATDEMAEADTAQRPADTGPAPFVDPATATETTTATDTAPNTASMDSGGPEPTRRDGDRMAQGDPEPMPGGDGTAA